jgi:hypothetical protein
MRRTEASPIASGGPRRRRSAGGPSRPAAAGIHVAKPGLKGNWLELDVDKSDDAVTELNVKYALRMTPGPRWRQKAGENRMSHLFDTDMGNDIDDALALGSSMPCRAGASASCSPSRAKTTNSAAPFVNLVNTFYGRGRIPVGVVRNGKRPKTASTSASR